MATMSEGIENLAREIAKDQIAQDIKFNEKLNQQAQSIARLLALEARVKRLIDIVWAEEKIDQLTLSVDSTTGDGAFLVRLQALESKVHELETKSWKQEKL